MLALLTSILAPAHAVAQGYPYLIFETADGTKTSVAVESLTLTLGTTTLTAGTKQFALADLTKMYFSATSIDGEGGSDAVEGDVNGDGTVDATDVSLTARHIIGHTADGFSSDAADLNGDGMVDAADLTAIIALAKTK